MHDDQRNDFEISLQCLKTLLHRFLMPGRALFALSTNSSAPKAKVAYGEALYTGPAAIQPQDEHHRTFQCSVSWLLQQARALTHLSGPDLNMGQLQ